MPILNALGGVVGFLVALAALAIETWVIAATARRVLGVPVGWFRSLLVALLTATSFMEFARWAAATGRFGFNDPQTYAGSIMLFMAMVVLWAFALGAAVLVGLEIIWPTGSLPSARALLFGWPSHLRRGRRYTEVLGIAAKHGLGTYLRGRRGSDDPEEVNRTARALRLALNDAGVTFVKVGQMLSTRADLLPAPFIRELSLLQTKAAPQDWEAVATTLTEELGRPPSEAFATIDHEPLASASVAQVHAATLADGTPLVVKVQRAGAQAQVERDVDILLRLGRTLDRNAAWARHLGVRSLTEGFAQSLREELDYRVEAANVEAVHGVLGRSDIRVPALYPELCTPRVLVMERFDGTPVGQAGPLLATLAPEVRRAAADRLLAATLGQIVGDGVFHADLHPGNVFVWPDGSVGLLDFGAVGRLDPGARRQMALLFWAVDQDDHLTATDCLIELLDSPADLDERALERQVGELLTRFRAGLGRGGSAEMFNQLFQLVIDHRFTVPPQVAAAFRCLGALEGTLKRLDPDLDVVASARTVGRDLMGDRMSPDALSHELQLRALRLLPLADNLPRRLNKLSEDLEQGRFSARVRVLADPDDRRFVTGLVQQLIVAILSGSSAIAGILLLISDRGPGFLPGISFFALGGYLLVFAGFLLALRAVAMMFGADRRF